MKFQLQYKEKIKTDGKGMIYFIEEKGFSY